MSKGTVDQILDLLRIDFDLKPEQRQTIKMMEWLQGDEHAHEGRTTALALFYIKRAMDNPGKAIEFQDHRERPSSLKTSKTMRHAIKHFLGRLPCAHREQFYVNGGYNTLTFRAEHFDSTIGANENGDVFQKEIPLGEAQPCILTEVRHVDHDDPMVARLKLGTEAFRIVMAGK